MQGEAPERDGDLLATKGRARGNGDLGSEVCALSNVTPSSLTHKTFSSCRDVEISTSYKYRQKPTFLSHVLGKYVETLSHATRMARDKKTKPRQDADLANGHDVQTQSPCSSGDVFHGSPSPTGRLCGLEYFSVEYKILPDLF